MQIFFTCLSIAFLISAALMAIRNWCVYSIRIAFINQKPAAYRQLPSYDAMMQNPRYWHMWTKKQWDKWLER